MKLYVVLLAALVAATHATEKWSWGEADSGSNSRSKTSSKVTFDDNNSRKSSRNGKVLFQDEQNKSTAPQTRQARKIESSSNVQERKIEAPPNVQERKAPSSFQGDGKTEPRFFGIKKELCKHGLAINCPTDDYEYIEVEDNSYGVPYPPPPPPPSPYGGIDQHQLLKVQPVALQPVGAPIQAIPLGPHGGGYGGGVAHGGGYGGGVVHGGGFGGGYGGGVAHGGALQVGAGYPLPQVGGFPYGGGFPLPLPVPLQHEAHGGGGHEADHEVHEPAHHEVKEEVVHKEVHQEPVHHEPVPQIVKHYHTHTHIHKNLEGGAVPYASELYSGGGSHVSSSYEHSRPPRRHVLPVVQPHQSVINPVYTEECECVPSYFCPAHDVIGRSNNELPLIDARNTPSDILSNATETKDDKAKAPKNKNKKSKREIKTTFKVFRSPEKDVEGRQAVGTSRIRNHRSSISSCPRGEVCCRSPGFSSRQLTYSCGKRNTAGILGRVQNQQNKQVGDTEFGEYPWQAALLKRESREVIYVCGGALVNNNHVVTAAHCVNNMKPHELKVRLGEWDVNRKTEFYDHVELDVTKILIHPSFYSGTLQNDIALLALSDGVNFESYPHINPVCLPHSHSDFSNLKCHVTGWGKDAFGNSGEFQYILKEVEVPVWGHVGCESALRQTRLGGTYVLDKGMLCAGGEEGKDACKGDGGGPLVCTGKDGSMELAGIVSWGIGCGERGIPGVYVSIPHYMEWLTNSLYTMQ